MTPCADRPAQPIIGTPCDQLAVRWLLLPDLARKLYEFAADFETVTARRLYIISGYRTPECQTDLAERGRPAAPVDRSNHTVCPSRAADVWFEGFAATSVKAALGVAAIGAGLRWGGGSPVDPDTGIPSDWNHVDLGPRPAG